MGLLMVRLIHPKATRDHCGLIPFMIDPDDPRPAKEQFNENYQHGGGWHSLSGFTLGDEQEGENVLKYPGDPSLHPIAEIFLRKEQILIYEYGLVAVIQPDRSFEVCRMD
jgi:hypothetical protein